MCRTIISTEDSLHLQEDLDRYMTGLNIGKSSLTFKNVLPYNVLGHTLLRPQNTPVIFLNLNTNVIEKCKGKWTYELELSDIKVYLSVLVINNLSRYTGSYIVLTTVVLCIMHRLICTNLKECCHPDLINPCKVGWCIFKCESRFEVLPPLSRTLKL